METPKMPVPAPTGSRHLIAPEFHDALDRFPAFDLTDEFLAAARAAMSESPGMPAAEPTADQQAIRCEQRFVPGLGGAPDVRLLVYTPPGAAESPRPVFLAIHGGGYVLGSVEMLDQANRAIAGELDCVVVGVAYRLAPETRSPGAVEDCYAALRWVHDHADELGVDRARIAIGGESAGAGHAAALALYARDRGEIPICFQLLDSPMLDDRTGSTADPHPHCGEFVWTPASNRFGWRALLGQEPGTVGVPRGAVPARADNLASLPPAFILVGSADLFLEESMEYARRLVRAGVPTELHVISGAFHGFTILGVQSELVRTSVQLSRQALARAFTAPRSAPSA